MDNGTEDLRCLRTLGAAGKAEIALYFQSYRAHNNFCHLNSADSIRVGAGSS